jgi:hypothetical protein
MIFLESIGIVVNKVGTMYPALASVDGIEPDLDNGISVADSELNCDVFKSMTWGDREFLRRYVGEQLYVTMEAHSSINRDSEWTEEDQLNAVLIEATDGMRGL